VKRFTAFAVFVIAFLAVIVPTKADEGMWTLNNLPVKQIQEKYGFTVTPEWVRHVQLSSARLPNCSSSFVSDDGLVFTNGHCAEESVQALSTPGNNLYEKGFYARTHKEELKTDRNLRVLVSINPENEASRAGLTCEVVILYQGGLKETYCYKVYDDVRLVFSTEKNVWFMGGDADNFEYPRYAMDVAFFRAYENGKPAKTPEHFKWSKVGAKEDELIFVSGHPGSTKRLLTSAALKTERDIRVPFLLDLFRRRELTLQQFMLRGKEQHRIAESDLFSWQNSRKLYVGKIRGLQDPALVKAKEDFEKKFFAECSPNPSLCNKFADGLIIIGDAQESIRANYAKAMLLNRGLGFDSRLFGYAQSLASGNKQMAKNVFSAREHEEPLNLEYEEAKLTDSLTHFIEVFGADSIEVKNLVTLFSPPLWKVGVGPRELADLLVNGTALSDVNAHRMILETVGTNTNDPMITLAMFIRERSKIYQPAFDNASENEKRGYALLSDALFKAYGTERYPDATFTLRLSFGEVSGYVENNERVKPVTTIGGVYKHSAEFGNKGDYKLPAKWWARKKFVKLNTPLDFVSNLDITGGNSGSPVFNRNREIVGIVFDSNIDGLVSDYDFNYAENARAVAVDSRGIVEVLKKIYHADPLIAELKKQ